MLNGLMPLAGLCALSLACAGCGSDDAPVASSGGGSPTKGGSGTAAPSGGGGAGDTAAGRGGAATSGSSAASAGGSSAGASPSTGSAGSPGEGSGPPLAVDGQSIYALECHGESKDCQAATVPCFGVGSATPNVAAGWACANRCVSDAECSDAPSGAEAQASCVSFTSAGHCVLVCQHENQSFSCPTGMTCYTPPKSPVGYCLWPPSY
jgi:hypothetical protein